MSTSTVSLHNLLVDTDLYIKMVCTRHPEVARWPHSVCCAYSSGSTEAQRRNLYRQLLLHPLCCARFSLDVHAPSDAPR